ncbi:hypothetical protein M885DRAFT_436346 [Pelagophyceae sp. CCMP2097]|nr:hypothetical protein M885DRAFT_436346 [Pelagophyceae sp. CCMP2097]
MHRLSKQGFSKSLAAQLLSVCLLIYAWRALEPQASRWANDSKAFDPYQVLQLQRDCEDSSIRKSYRDLSRMHHPDKGGDASKFMELASAYQVRPNTPPEVAGA